MLLLDVTPHSLGIMVVGGYFHRLIDRNTTVPTSKSHVFTTIRDDQTSVNILVFQGESDRAEENEMLGEFVLSGPDALALIQKATINDASTMDVGQAQYSAMCRPNGGIVDASYGSGVSFRDPDNIPLEFFAPPG